MIRVRVGVSITSRVRDVKCMVRSVRLRLG